MCRNRKILGAGILGGGIGLFFGLIFPPAFWLFLVAIGLIVLGIVLMSK